MNSRFILAGLCVMFTACASTGYEGRTELLITAHDYAAAERLISHHIGDTVSNDRIELHWLEKGSALRYQREGQDGPEHVRVITATGEKHLVDAPEPPPAPPASPGMLSSPDGKRSAFVRDHDLWIIDNGVQRRLTSDGAPFFAWGGVADQLSLQAKRTGVSIPLPPMNVHWSPDGRYLVAGRLDERDVREYAFLESVPSDGSPRARNYSVRVPLLGEAEDRRVDTVLIDIESGEHRDIRLPEGYALRFFATQNTPLSWSEDSELVYFIAATTGDQRVRLLEVDMATGDARTILEETSESSVTLGHDLRARQNVRVLEDSREVIWFSERDGWGHLYLFDLGSGALKSQITTGAWLVWEILEVDEQERVIFFTAGGREPGSDPYYRKLYRVSFDGSDLQLLTPEEAHHEILGTFSPGNRYFVDSYSTVDSPTVTVLRSLDDGRVITILENADATALYAVGWRAPERFRVKAADGTTDLWATVYLPFDFDVEGSYPVIDAIYGGPVSVIAARSFRDGFVSGYQQASLARLGFIVFSLDGRGTPFRSRVFREAGYGNFADPQLEDHAAALEQIATRYPAADLTRTGIYGHSNGGYMAARAMLKHPDSFAVGIASAGPHNFQGLPGTGTPWMGIPRYEDGATTKPGDAAMPENYRVLDNATFASGLQGRLLLICGDMDNTAFPALTLQLANALIDADKSFDILYLPNRTHSYFVEEPYVMRRVWDYFVEHLQGQLPPANFKMRDYGPLVYR